MRRRPILELEAGRQLLVRGVDVVLCRLLCQLKLLTAQGASNASLVAANVLRCASCICMAQRPRHKPAELQRSAQFIDRLEMDVCYISTVTG